MKVNFKKIFTNWRVLLLLIFLVLAVISIRPQLFGTEGVTIRSVVQNSSATLAGIENPSAKTSPVSKEKIVSINGQKIIDLADYYTQVNQLPVNQTVRVETNKGIYNIVTVGDESLGLTVYDAPASNLRGD